ncbi:MAG: hypothetical protein CFH16_00722 [Alphaproteobacteria bacterium MarineAlpha5_Bin6]|nr:MAG: hypothetical protein CFH17_00544 [Alphaproteobacteria bacterium MarineAlpha5_Bin7]PPR53963.1 MAG: hypothetical protein CFH16_00722 [Alphaproteobacteria bacterium MarineAlpha5_Bin6]|tara:strand:- start:2223 stop:2606 length:384 start_codon:yes stop_codon:yes gene_type:complete
MIVNTPISLGELIDKISILIIKEKNIQDSAKLVLIKNELKLLNDTVSKVLKVDNIKDYLDKLIEINSQLWKIEDDIRECEHKKNFDENFVQLARLVYVTNDKRAAIKLEINKKFGSEIIEVKSYNKY